MVERGQRTNLKEILNEIYTIDDLNNWAFDNELVDHPWVTQRKDAIICKTVITFTDITSLSQWAIDNNALCHNQVLQRMKDMLTCKVCNKTFDFQSQLKEHETMHLVLDEFVQGTSQNVQSLFDIDNYTTILNNSNHVESNSDLCHSSEMPKLNSPFGHYHVSTKRTVIDDVFNANNFLYPTSKLTNPTHFNGESNLPSCSNNGILREQVGKGSTTNNKDNSAYIFRKTGEKTFTKNLAVETTYKIKFTNTWQGKKLKTILTEIRGMFTDVLDKARGDNNDLGRVIINHPGLNNAIVVPLQKWSFLNSDKVLENIERVLNSDENLTLDNQMQVTIGNIKIPQGTAATKITLLSGPQSSIALKRSLLQISNDDKLCMAHAIGRCFLKLCKIVPLDEWKRVTKNDPKHMNSMMKVIKHRITTKSFYKHIGDSSMKRYGKNMALTLCREAGVSTEGPLGISDIKPFEDLLEVNILVISSKLGNKFCRVVNNPLRKNLYLYLTNMDDESNGHFDGIGNINGFFAYGNFCETCLKPYKMKGKHSCETTCNVCCRDPCLVEIERSCRSCHRTCRSLECYEAHISHRNKKGQDVDKSLCDKIYQCKQCRKVLEREQRKPEDHVCGEYKCRNCFEYFLDRHMCYQRKSITTNNIGGKVPRKFFFYDFETTQDERMSCTEGYEPSTPCDGCTLETLCNKCRLCTNCNESSCGLEEHKVNFAVLQSTCEKCIDYDLDETSRCQICGSRCVKCRIFKQNKCVLPCQDSCGYRQRVFKGYKAVIEFCDHIMTPCYKNTVLIAHNAKGFDNYPILNTLITYHSVKPHKILYNGSKIMYMKVGKGIGLTFLDSLNFIGMRLSKIPSCFDLKELQKGYFPHRFNTKANQNYVGPYPDQAYYGCNYMESGEREKFLQWYASKRANIFDFQREMYAYCVSDVDILRRGCMKFRQLLMEVTSQNGTKTGVDPFDYVTIAAVCQGIYRHLFLEETYQTKVLDITSKQWSRCQTRLKDEEWEVLLPNNTWVRSSLPNDDYKIGKRVFCKSPIGIVPSEGYCVRDNFSKASIQWLEWIMWSTNKSKKNGVLKIQHALNGGEYRVRGTKYRLDGYDESTKTAYEFLGCVFHGCHTCFPNDRRTTTHPVTRHSMNELYYMTKKKKDKLLALGYRYESIWEHEFKQQLELNVSMKEFVKSLDITDRLDPRDSFFGGRTNAIKLFHETKEIGETIEYYDFTSLYPSVNKYAKYPVGHPTIITSNFKPICEYFGMAKLILKPPRQLYHPVLPYLSNGKLKFPLCRTCADTENENDCQCSDEDRSLTGTWCTPEIQLACSKGYEIIKIYEIYHFEETSCYDKIKGTGGLFTEYVNMFLKLKQEASGFPSDCNTIEEKYTYIKDYARHEGIHLNFESIKKNPGLRNLAKICLNSFWGKFGQHLNMKQSSFLHEHEADKFFQLLSDTRKDVRDFHIVSNDIIQLEYYDSPTFLPFDCKTNIFIASFTTAWARIRLYELLDITQRNALYVDTDSIIFHDTDKQITRKLPVGNYLGELTSEISPEEGHITTFVSSGPKSYAYRTKLGTEICKVRGFTLNWTNTKLINLSNIKEIVLTKDTTTTITTTNPRKISRISRKRKLCNRIEQKEFRMVYTKRRLLDDFSTEPYGY